MVKNVLITAIFVALGAVVAVTFFDYKKESSETLVCTMDAMRCPDGSYVGREGPNCEFKECSEASVTYAWVFKEKGEEEGTGAPLTEVSLTYSNITKVVGTYQGSCVVIDGAAWKLLAGEKTGVICWFAGGGNEIGIFEEDGRDVLKVGGVEEGDAETPGSRAGFKTVMSF